MPVCRHAAGKASLRPWLCVLILLGVSSMFSAAQEDCCPTLTPTVTSTPTRTGSVIPTLMPGVQVASWVYTARLVPTEGPVGYYLGSAVAASSNTIAALSDDDLYVFECIEGDWIQTAWFPHLYSMFCYPCLSIDTTILAAGGGHAVVYEKADGTWAYVTDLLAGGASVSVNGSSILTAPSGFLFEKVAGQWVQSATLEVTDSGSLGFPIALGEGVALVGSPDDREIALRSGAAHVFEKVSGGWTQTAKLFASNAAGNNYFGRTVALKANLAFIADLDSVFVFEESEGVWGEPIKLEHPSGYAPGFGSSLAVEGNTLIVGSPDTLVEDVFPSNKSTRTVGEQDCGSVVVFGRRADGWVATGEVSAPTPSNGDKFGYSVALSGNTLVVGAPAYGLVSPGPGAVYVFNRVEETPTTQITLTPTPTTTSTPTPTATVLTTPATTVTPTATPLPQNADINNDGQVDHQDLLIFQRSWYRVR